MVSRGVVLVDLPSSQISPMLPLKNTPTVCLTQTNLIALMSTAVVITAAATFWCARRFRTSCKILTASPVSAPVSPQVNTIANTSNITDDLSYLCTSCGTEKYSPEQLAASTASKSSSPYKMVILVRTDLNMVTQTYTLIDLFLFRVKERLPLSVVTPFWLLTRLPPPNQATPSNDGSAKANPK